MCEKVLHAIPPVVPAVVYPQLMKDAEEFPETRLAIGYVPATKTVVLGRCVNGSVETWNSQSVVEPEDISGLIALLQQDTDVPSEAVSYRQFDHVPEGRLN